MPEIEGTLESVIYRNDENGYSVISLKSANGRVTCVGALPAFTQGERLRVTGEWTEHRDYGRQLRVTSFESAKPSSETEIEKYLASGVVKGVGTRTAKLIVRHFGIDALDILDDDPSRFGEVPGIGPKRARRIALSYEKQRGSRKTMLFLQSLGIGPNMAGKVMKALGDDTFDIVSDDPYVLADRVEGIGFRIADGIAMSLGVDLNSEHRITCAVNFVLEEAVAADGHVYLPKRVVTSRARGLLSCDESLVDRAIVALALAGKLVLREDRVYLARLYKAERDVAGMIVGMLAGKAPDGDELEEDIADCEAQRDMTLSHEQRQAVVRSCSERVTILTGGPGTGKTTCVNYILWLLKKKGTVKLCAPTGRAAKRMQEATGEEAMTIHRMLEYSGEDGGFMKNSTNRLDCDAVVVDEMSMVDIFLMQALLRALKDGARLVMVGDIDQLASVGAGNVLKDLVESGAVPVNRLSRIYRQAEMSYIVKNAHSINRGESPVFNTPGTDCFFEAKYSPDEAAESVVELVTRRLPKFLGLRDSRDIQVMTPMKKGVCGVFALNIALQEALNPMREGMSRLKIGEGEMRQNDRVMQIKNNYDILWTRGEEEGSGAFNGDIGYIQDIDEEEHIVSVLFDDGRLADYEAEDLEQLRLAYCMSVHKSQGSEFDVIVLPLVSGPRMLYTRNLLYTALTRARKLAVVVGRRACVDAMVENDYVSDRYTTLKDAILELMVQA